MSEQEECKKDKRGKVIAMIENGRIRIYPAGQEQMESNLLKEAIK